MPSQPDIVGDCTGLLRQGSVVIGDTPDDVFTAVTPISPRGSIGAHFRHLLNFYDRFLLGMEEARVDYNHRDRDSAVEHNRYHALQKCEETILRLEQLELSELNQHLLVSTENDSLWSRSSVLRELDFLLSHTVHHYSLIAMLLRLYEIDPGDEFGVAPSTLQYWKQELLCAR